MSPSDIESPDDRTSPLNSEELQQLSDAAYRHHDRQMIGGRFALTIILLMVLLADVCLYQAEGFFGPAVFFCGAAVLIAVGIPRRSLSWVSLTLIAAILLVAWRLCVNGFTLQLLVGFWLITSLVLSLRRQTPFVMETLFFAAQSVPGGYEFFHRINNRVRKQILDPIDQQQPSRIVEVAMPAVVAILFSGIFVMANPDVVSWVSVELARILNATTRFLFRFSVYEVMFWGIVGWLTGGLLRPFTPTLKSSNDTRDSGISGSSQAPLYAAFRNTLVAVNVVFGLYLSFESRAWSTAKLPRGFTYSSYAHEGAAWLTVALALATLTLSLIFRDRTLSDPRLQRLKMLAWIWSAFNLILATAVYNRMWIYVSFNGMTRMRIIGLLGITSVVIGFVIVLIKIGKHRHFEWLIQRQLCVIAIATYTYAVIPVDSIIHTYNVAKILNGNEAPIVQITAHGVDNEALPTLLPLCETTDERVRSGIQALLSIRFEELQQTQQRKHGWTARQLSHGRAFAQLEAHRTRWEVYDSEDARIRAWQQLQDYAFQKWW